MTIQEVAELLRVDHQTVRRYIRRGTLDAYRPINGRILLIKSADVDKLIQPVLTAEGAHMPQGGHS